MAKKQRAKDKFTAIFKCVDVKVLSSIKKKKILLALALLINH